MFLLCYYLAVRAEEIAAATTKDHPHPDSLPAVGASLGASSLLPSALNGLAIASSASSDGSVAGQSTPENPPLFDDAWGSSKHRGPVDPQALANRQFWTALIGLSVLRGILTVSTAVVESLSACEL